MAKGKDVRVRVLLECTLCVPTSGNNKSPGISFQIYYSKESTQYAQSIRIEKILSLLFQTYTSWGDQEIDGTAHLRVTFRRKMKTDILNI
jgi:hypothetical protein